MAKSVLLVGCGAEIGAMLVGMVDPANDGLAIDAILTNPIPPDARFSQLSPLQSLLARIVLAQPQMVDLVTVEGECLLVRGRSIDVHWGDSREYDLTRLSKNFDACVLATSKKQIDDPELVGRFESVADLVVGVAEAGHLPSAYINLVAAPQRFLSNPPRPVGRQRSFALGSCQSVGWQAQLRGLLETLEDCAVSQAKMRSMEVDIVHPDTPTGRLGTKSVGPREQEARNNLRPGFSQVERAMNIIFPGCNNTNTISLRTLISPPGYQVTRYFFSYGRTGDARITQEEMRVGFARAAKRCPEILRTADLPLGSRAYEFCESSAVVLSDDSYLRYRDDAFGVRDEGPVISQLTVQAYVHNTRGYCRSIVRSLQYLLNDPNPKAFFH